MGRSGADRKKQTGEASLNNGRQRLGGGEAARSEKRILKIDFASQKVTIDNTLGGEIRVLPLTDFVLCWFDPENRATNPASIANKNSFWAISIIPLSQPQ